MGKISRIKTLVLILSLSVTYGFAHQAVWVYSLSNISLTNVPDTVTVCQLDTKTTLRLPVSVALSLNRSVDIEAWMKGSSTKVKIFSEQMVCRYQAEFLNLQYLPAVVMDGKYVVYGDDDVQNAIQAIKHYQTRCLQQGGAS